MLISTESPLQILILDNFFFLIFLSVQPLSLRAHDTTRPRLWWRERRRRRPSNCPFLSAPSAGLKEEEADRPQRQWGSWGGREGTGSRRRKREEE